MAGEDMIMARPGELKRLHVIQKVLERVIRQVEAAEILSLSSRQIRRIVKGIRFEGDKGIVHKSRGRTSNRRIPDKIRNKVLRLYRKKYQDFGPMLASEKLLERDGVGISDETLRMWLMESGDWKKIRKARGHRQWRQRRDHYGEMVQMDGSHHDWLEGRGPWCVFMGYIDDAMGEVFGRFYPYEGTIPAMDSFKRYIRRNGLPMSVYLDKHTTYKSTAKPTIQDQLNNTGALSEFERALEELGVKVIHANSPQAKGRIERLFKTLQDRLVKEMRLRGIRTIEEANCFLEEYLPVYNRRFAVSPKGKDNLHRPLGREVDLDGILCIKTERTLRNDFTVAHSNKLYQVEDHIHTSKVIVEDRLDGSVRITCKSRTLKFKELRERPKPLTVPSIAARVRRPPTPPTDHPWRDFKFGKHRYERRRPIESQP